MKSALFYSTGHGRTKRVVEEALKHLNLTPEIFSVRDLAEPPSLDDVELLLFFCPTYGDEELQEDMERFLLSFRANLSGKFFVVCELGNYYGYDDFTFGAMKIIRARLIELGGAEFASPLSLDSLPKVHMAQLIRWVHYLNTRLEAYVRP